MSSDTQRLRITFAKDGPIKYSSHLDLMRAWERALRRASVPLAYSGGYNPRPKLQLAKALPLGHSAEAEILDIWLEEPTAIGDLIRSLVPVLPDELGVRRAEQVDPKAPAMQTQVVATEYRVAVEWDEPPAAVEERIEHTLAAEELPHQRRGKRYNLRPLVEKLWLEEATNDKAVVGMRLSARPGATGRPEAVLDVLGMGQAFARYQRKRLICTSTPNSS